MSTRRKSRANKNTRKGMELIDSESENENEFGEEYGEISYANIEHSIFDDKMVEG